MASPLDSSSFVRLLDARLREVSERKFTELHTVRDQLYRTIQSDSAWEEFFSVGAVPDIPQFLGKITYLGIAPGYHIKMEPNEYSGGIQSERKLVDDKKYAVLDDRAAGLAVAADRTQEKSAAVTFTSADSSAFQFMISEEKKSLVNDAHQTKSGTSTTSGFDNKGTTALNKTSLAAAWLVMRRFRNDISQRIEMSDNYMLIVPDTLGDKADEIVGTPKGLHSGEGTINPQQGRYKVFRYMRLDDSDTNNWYLVNVDQMKRDLLWVNRMAPEFKTTVDFETYMLKNAVYMRYACGFLDWRWIYGSIVA